MSALVSIVTFLVLAQDAHSFGVQIPAGGMASCFFREIHASSRVSVHYIARETVNVNIKTPSGTVLHIKRSVLQGEYTFDAKEEGPYQICLSTDLMRRVPTTIKFRFLVFDPSLLTSDLASSVQAFDAHLLCHEVSKISEKVLYATHIYSDTAIAADDALKNSVALTGRLAALECVAVLVVALGQVTHVRNMLAAARSRLQRMV